MFTHTHNKYEIWNRKYNYHLKGINFLSVNIFGKKINNKYRKSQIFYKPITCLLHIHFSITKTFKISSSFPTFPWPQYFLFPYLCLSLHIFIFIYILFLSHLKLESLVFVMGEFFLSLHICF